ncbi:hypothetical protein GE061_014106 [Apolygus lucorum]|uniref:Uncharacterized protein n=1 Tax=Apolygus lucorum TaxID=248454 RepID=A0A8S9XPW7_APOLU|nr:hypothetical protein GE061_014106 [Apolygus lucorum]
MESGENLMNCVLNTDLPVRVGQSSADDVVRRYSDPPRRSSRPKRPKRVFSADSEDPGRQKIKKIMTKSEIGDPLPSKVRKDRHSGQEGHENTYSVGLLAPTQAIGSLPASIGSIGPSGLHSFLRKDDFPISESEEGSDEEGEWSYSSVEDLEVDISEPSRAPSCPKVPVVLPPASVVPISLQKHLDQIKAPMEEVSPVEDHLIAIFSNHMRSGLPIDYFKSLLEKYKPTGKLTPLAPPSLDRLIMEAIPKHLRGKDVSDQKGQDLQSAAIVASGSALSMVVGDTDLNLPATREQLVEKMWHASALQCALFFRTSNARRRSALGPFTHDFKEVAMSMDIGVDQLFDNKAQQLLTQVQEMKRLSSQIVTRKPRQIPPNQRAIWSAPISHSKAPENSNRPQPINLDQ